MSICYIDAFNFVSSREKESRLCHSVGVAKVAESLSKRFKLNTENALIAGIYHDAYRYSCDQETIKYCQECGWEVFEEEKENVMLLHGALAASNMRKDLGAVDFECLKAVRYHTLGSVDMGLLGAVIYIADYIEPSRVHLTDEDRRNICSKQSLEEMVLAVMDKQKIYFEKKGIKEAEVSKKLYNYLVAGGKF